MQNATNPDYSQYRINKIKAYLACEGGKTSAKELIPPSLGFLWIFVSAVKATPIE